jgi:hypothetical protein
MAKYMTYADSIKCKVHKDLVERCEDALTSPPGAFHKQTILEASGYEMMEGAIRWDYIIRAIENGMGMQKGVLFPLAEAFWDRGKVVRPRAKKDPNESEEDRADRLDSDRERLARRMTDQEWLEDKLINPQRYVARGHSKKTAGYGLMDDSTGHFAMCILEHRIAVASGSSKAAKENAKLVLERVPSLGEGARKRVREIA